MKSSKRVISIVLSVVMIFSMASAVLAGTLKTEDESYNSVETLIAPDHLAEVVKSLITDLNGAKENFLPPVLRLVYSFMGSTFEVSGDMSKLSEEELATILVNWLNKEENLPKWTAGIAENDTFKRINRLIKLDLKTVHGLINAIYEILTNPLVKTVMLTMGDARSLKADTLKDVATHNRGNWAELKAVVAFLNANKDVLGKIVNGKFSLGVANDLLSDFYDSMANLKLFIKSALYKLINGDAAVGKFDKDPVKAAGDWGQSDYKDHTSDQLLGAALLHIVNNNAEFVSKDEAEAALKLSFYELLRRFAENMYKLYGIDFVNNNLGKFISDISVTPEIKALYKEEIPQIDETTIADLFENAKTTGILGQLNNLVDRVAELILKPEEYTKLGLVKGGNENLNANLEKIFKLALPLMANDTVKNNLGYDFSAFKADAVKDMSTEDMAVAVLKLFFKDWFGSNEKYDAEIVESAETLEQLGLLAVYYTATNTNWLNLDYDFTQFEEVLFDGKKIKAFEQADAKETAVAIGAGIGAGAMKYNGAALFYESDIKAAGIDVLLGDVNGSGEVKADDARLALRLAVGFDDSDTEPVIYLEAADADKNGVHEANDARAILRAAVSIEPLEGTVKAGGGNVSWKDYIDDISDWGINYVRGIPAIYKAKNVTTERNVYDPYNDGVFNKVNLALNALIDFSFLNNAGSDNYKLDLGTLLYDGLLGNIFDFDVAGLLGIFAVNDSSTNILGKEIVPAALGAIDRIITAMFKAA